MNYRKIINYFIILMLIIATLQCNNTISPNDQVNTSIYGTWNWVKSCGGYFGSEEYPPPSKSVVFKDDSTCIFYRNDTLLTKLAFLLTREIIPGFQDTQDVITFAVLPPDTNSFIIGAKNIYNITNQSLVIQALCADCFTSYYTRSN